MRVDFVACGNLTIDDVVTADGAVSIGVSGGNGLYAAVGMRLCGGEVGLVAGAGRDYPREWLERLDASGIDVAGVYELDEPHLLRSRSFYRTDGSRTDRRAEVDLPAEAAALLDLSSDFSAFGSDVHLGAWGRYSPRAAQVPRAYCAARAAHLAPGPHGNLRELAGLWRAEGATCSLDWPWWDESEGALDRQLLADIDVVLPGAEELVRWPVAGSPEGTVAALAQLAPVLVVKQGRHGVRVHAGERVTAVGVYPVRERDPTGAGDAFCGGFAVGLARTGDPEAAACYGAAAASAVLQHTGALDALAVTEAEIEHRAEVLLETLSTRSRGDSEHAG